MNKFLKVGLIAAFLATSTSALFLSGCKGDTPTTPNEQTPPAQSATFTVTVKSQGGMPIAGATVTASANGAEVGSATTAKDGTASFTIDAGNYDLSVSGMPAGYTITRDYDLTAGETAVTIIASSSVIDESIPDGTTYELGSFMYDVEGVYYNDPTKTYKLSTLLEEKKAVILNFWYVDCYYCREEFPVMEKAYQNYKDDVEILAFNCPTSSYPNGDDESRIDTIVSTLTDKNGNVIPLSFPVLATTDNTRKLVSAFGVNAYPTTVVIDRYGVVAFQNAGAEPEQEAWEKLFSKYASDDYSQDFEMGDEESGPVQEKPDVTMPDSALVEAAINNGVDFTYYAIPEGEEDSHAYSWPWLVSEDGKSIYPSNQGKNSTYSILYSDISLKQGDVLTFDYQVSTEKDYDVLYVNIDNREMHHLSGNEEKTCFAFVADRTATYHLALMYIKDNSDDRGNTMIKDTVSVSNMRVLTTAGITDETYILRCAADDMNADETHYNAYITPVYNEADGFYHVNAADGPFLLANLLSATNWSRQSVYAYAADSSKDYLGTYNESADSLAMMEYIRVASSSENYAYCTVDKPLAELLKKLTRAVGANVNDKEWLEICYYYDAYGGAKVMNDFELNPIKGLTYQAAYPVEEGENATVTIDRAIISGNCHVYYKFIPATSGVYKATSFGTLDSDCFVFDADGNLIGYNSDDIDYDPYAETYNLNFSKRVYLEGGKEYYIGCGFHFRGTIGTYEYKITRIADSFYEWRLAIGDDDEFFFTMDEEMSQVYMIARDVIAVEEGDGKEYFYVKNADGSTGSKIWLDMTRATGNYQYALSTMIENAAGVRAFEKIPQAETVAMKVDMETASFYAQDPAQGNKWAEVIFDNSGWYIKGYETALSDEEFNKLTNLTDYTHLVYYEVMSGTGNDAYQLQMDRFGRYYELDFATGNWVEVTVDDDGVVGERTGHVYDEEVTGELFSAKKLSYVKGADGKVEYKDYTARMKQYLNRSTQTNGYIAVDKELAGILNAYLFYHDEDFFNMLNGEQAWMLFGTYCYDFLGASDVTPEFPNAPKQQNVTATVTPITVKVVDENGNAVAGVQVTFKGSGSNSQTFTTNENGVATLEIGFLDDKYALVLSELPTGYTYDKAATGECANLNDKGEYEIVYATAEFRDLKIDLKKA